MELVGFDLIVIGTVIVVIALLAVLLRREAMAHEADRVSVEDAARRVLAAGRGGGPQPQAAVRAPDRV